jgi:peptide/nickel transport system substrate-binding protein
LKAANPNWNVLVATKLAWIASPTALKADPVNFGAHPVGAGPFLMKDWVRDSQYTLVRNPNYWEKGRPYLDTVTVNIVLDATAAYNTFKSGAANALVLFDPAIIGQAKQDGYRLTYSSMNGGGWGLALNNSKPPFNDPRVRKAIDLALDRKQFNAVRRNSDPSALMTSPEKPGTPFYDARIAVPKYDLAGAQKLIDQVVAETGKPVTFTITVFSTQYLSQDAEVVQSQLQKLKNVQVNLETLASANAVSKRNTGDFQAIFDLERWNEPSTEFFNYYRSGSAQNFSRYSNPTVDSQLDQLLTATDQKTRSQLLRSAEQQILKDSPVVWWTRYASAQVLDKTLRDYKQYFDQIALLDNVWIAGKR